MRITLIVLCLLLVGSLVFGQTPNPAEPVPGDVSVVPGASSVSIQKGQEVTCGIIIKNNAKAGASTWCEIAVEYTEGTSTESETVTSGFWFEAKAPVTLKKITLTLPVYVQYVDKSANINGALCDTVISGQTLTITVPKTLTEGTDVTVRWKVKGI